MEESEGRSVIPYKKTGFCILKINYKKCPKCGYEQTQKYGLFYISVRMPSIRSNI